MRAGILPMAKEVAFPIRDFVGGFPVVFYRLERKDK